MQKDPPVTHWSINGSFNDKPKATAHGAFGLPLNNFGIKSSSF